MLNSNIPLAVLNEHNQAQNAIETKDYATRIAAALMDTAAQAAAAKAQAAGEKPTVSTSLQNNALRQKLDVLKEEPKNKTLGKASGGTGDVVPIKATVQAGLGAEISDPGSSPSGSPSQIAIGIQPPTNTPAKTPSPTPSPIPTPTPLPQPGPSPVIDVRKAALLNRLKQKVNEDLNFLERVKGYNTTKSALGVVFDNDLTLERMASRYDVPKSILQTIMFREQRFIDFRDTAADFLVGIGLRTQSSTGPMQVTTKTAIDAINYAVSEGYTTFNKLGISASAPLSKDNKDDRSEIWNMLNSDPDFNIEVAAQIVRMNADNEIKKVNIEDYSEDDLVKLLALYNGIGDAAKEYGEECYNWYQDFSWYN